MIDAHGGQEEKKMAAAEAGAGAHVNMGMHVVMTELANSIEFLSPFLNAKRLLLFWRLPHDASVEP